MATFYSNHYGPAVGATNHFTTRTPVPFMVPAGLKHARMRHTIAQLIVPSGEDLGNGDVIRLLDLRSNDRLINLFFSMDGNWEATTTFHVGLYLKGDLNAGAVVDVDLFAGTQDWKATIARSDLFTGANGALDDWDRGKLMWELAAIGDGSDTSDPGVVYTVAVTTTQDIGATDGAVEFLCEAEYIAGD